ncbi:hypothetical protein ABZ897_59470 [Nonomuraea sp. NPDC046802]|uniref:hypothetical protein n=1 Tax=Nonomuraea sp. NPDC046802 TaxID=3154919 RepID=UPI0033D53E9D
MSSTIEDRLRDALTARAQTVQDDGRFAVLPAPRTPRTRWALPVAVAAAMAVLIAVVTVSLRPSPPPRPAGPAPLPAFYAGSVLTERATTTGTGKVTAIRQDVGPWGVYDSRSGRRVTDLPLPVDTKVAGLGDGRTFFVVGRDRRTDPVLKFMKITLTSDGRIAAQTPLPLAVSAKRGGFTAFAVAPDGQALAFSRQQSGKCANACENSHAEVSVFDVPSRQTRRWNGSSLSYIQHLSWAGDGRWLAYDLAGSTAGVGEQGVLDASPGRELSRMTTVDNSMGYTAGRPHASTFVTVMSRTDRLTSLTEFSANDGKRLRDWTIPVWFTPLTFDATGRVLIGWQRPGKLARLDGDRLTLIPMPELAPKQHLQVAW